MKFFLFGILMAALLSLVGCNSAFPAHQSSNTMDLKQQSEEKACVDLVEKSSQKARQTTKTYKIIGE